MGRVCDGVWGAGTEGLSPLSRKLLLDFFYPKMACCGALQCYIFRASMRKAAGLEGPGDGI